MRLVGPKNWVYFKLRCIKIFTETILTTKINIWTYFMEYFTTPICQWVWIVQRYNVFFKLIHNLLCDKTLLLRIKTIYNSVNFRNPYIQNRNLYSFFIFIGFCLFSLEILRGRRRRDSCHYHLPMGACNARYLLCFIFLWESRKLNKTGPGFKQHRLRGKK